MSDNPISDRIDRRTLLRGAAAAGIVGVAGCSGNGGDGDDGSSDVIRWHAGGTGGTYFPLSGEFEGIIEDATDYSVEVSSTGASVENVGSLGNGDADFALIQNDVAYFARNGEGLDAFDGSPVENLRGVATLYPETIHVLTNPDSDIGSLSDLEGMRVNTGDLGSGTQVNALQILESAAGLTTDDFDEQNTDFTQAANQLRDGDVDAAFVVGGWPVGAVEELATSTDVGILNLSDEERQAARDDASWFADDTIPGGTYGGIDEDINTVSVQAMIATRAEYSADIVEGVTAAIFDNLGELSIKTDFITVDSAQDGMSIELHEGAARYFE
ncbi:TRAP transporter solute receptor, unknown substrate 1 [Halorubrum sp. DM2]|uniref:TAXI family TRAP transporter solute-binding subunit n=1 Tax=unclassified Halorubrum TaxID=2642239 RepID=UPI0003DCCC80|nr:MULTISPECIES: TAXI family TRAP transporter solute-binding subunit [unclassified Halorubrum]CDK39690.1 TRAP-type transport system periplasmic protein 1 [Halorubrum sp. AJ67]VTT88018.1 TRAP transporter solute receptor, unknown substrate 1 [Halorubrum sp. DM2]